MHNKSIICLCLILSLTLQPMAFGNEDGNAATAKTGDDSALHTTLAVTGGCVGGAALGTVVPIFGNMVGCVIGGLAGWWYSHKENSENTKNTAAGG